MNLVMTIITVLVILLIIGAALLMHYMSPVLAEFDDHFLRLTAFILLFMIAAAFYLSYAVPSIASSDSFERSGDIKVYRDTPTKNILEQFLEKSW